MKKLDIAREIVIQLDARGRVMRAAVLTSKHKAEKHAPWSKPIQATEVEHHEISDNDGTWRATTVEFGGSRTKCPFLKIDVFEKRISDR